MYANIANTNDANKLLALNSFVVFAYNSQYSHYVQPEVQPYFS